MNSFKKMAAQGDVLFIKVDRIPDGLEQSKAENGYHIVTHSETGHHHVVMERSAQMLIDKTNEFIAYLDIKEDCQIDHLRNHDTHRPISFKKGDKIQVRRQREYTPEGFRKAQD